MNDTESIDCEGCDHGKKARYSFEIVRLKDQKTVKVYFCGDCMASVMFTLHLGKDLAVSIEEEHNKNV